jgi:hypothetical protein
MNLREVRKGGRDSIRVVQDRDQWFGCYENCKEPLGSIKFVGIIEQLSD